MPVHWTIQELNTRKDLPYDVWLCVAEFLERATLRRLMSVNHAFFDAVLNLEYRNIDMYNLDRRNIHILRRLQDPYIASRVRTLRLAPRDLLPPARPPAPTPAPVKPRRMISRVRRAAVKVGVIPPRKSAAISTPKEPENAPISILENMDGLVALELHSWLQAAVSQNECALISSAWSIFGFRLRTLTLDLSIQNISKLLSPKIVFENLEALKIKVFDPDYTPDVEYAHILCAVLAPFINNHRLTLISFTASDIRSTDITPLLLCMGHFPRLKKIDIASTETPEGIQGIWHVLRLHAERLEEIRMTRNSLVHLPLYKGPAFARNPSFDLTLSISLQDPVGLACLKLICPQITSLQLTCHKYTYVDVCNILDVLGGNTKIRSVVMEIDFLSPQVIDVLAEKMPYLHKLRLSVGYYAVVGDKSVGIKAREKMFCKEMSERRYPDWELQSFDIGLLGVTSIMCDDVLFWVLPQARTRSLRF